MLSLLLFLQNIIGREYKYIDSKRLSQYQVIIIYAGAYLDFVKESLHFAKKNNKFVYFLGTGWDNLSSKIPLFENLVIRIVLKKLKSVFC